MRYLWNVHGTMMVMSNKKLTIWRVKTYHSPILIHYHPWSSIIIHYLLRSHLYSIQARSPSDPSGPFSPSPQALGINQHIGVAERQAQLWRLHPSRLVIQLDVLPAGPRRWAKENEEIMSWNIEIWVQKHTDKYIYIYVDIHMYIYIYV